MRFPASRLVTTVLLLLFFAVCTEASQQRNHSPTKKTALTISNHPKFGDFDEIRKRHVIRVAVPYSRTLFFNDRGIQRGITAEKLQEFERWINRRIKTGTHRIVINAIPVTRDRLIPMLTAGLADIAAGNLTITPDRSEQVDFTDPIGGEVDEIIVSGPSPLASLDELANQEVHVRPASSYYQNLLSLNDDLRQRGLPEMHLRLMPDALEDEDLLEMLNAGTLKFIVMDDWKARIWSNIFKNVVPHPELKVAEDGYIGWAFRKDSPKLKNLLNEYVAEMNRKGISTEKIARYQRRIKQLKNPTANADWQQFESTVELFKTYAELYRFDYLMITAQGFQESGLNQSARSPAGAIGIMQLLPATGAAMNVGDIRQIESNVHGGMKYMRKLINKYFNDNSLDEDNRTLFALAAYNAGPNRVARFRREAAKKQLNPNEWFGNVEIIAGQRVGQETVGYVRNIYKYYTAYKLQLKVLEERQSSLDP